LKRMNTFLSEFKTKYHIKQDLGKQTSAAIKF